MKDTSKTLVSDAFKEMLDNEVVIYAVLKSLHINKYANNSQICYEDLLSEARFLYLEAYETNHKTGKARFNYFYTKIYWGLLNKIKRENYISDKVQLSENIPDFDCNQIDETDLQELIEQKELLDKIRKVCNHNEWFFIKKRLEGIPVKEIAILCGVNRRTVYEWRKRLKKKIALILKK